MVGKRTRLQVIPQQSTQNTANLPLQTYEKKPRNNFKNSGSFAKVSIPVHIYNSLMSVTIGLRVVYSFSVHGKRRQLQ